MNFQFRMSMLVLFTLASTFTTSLQAQLPKPEGPFCIGKQKLLIDNQKRPEHYTEDRSDFRKVVLNIWYPGNCDGKPTSYLNPKIRDIFLAERNILDSLDITLFKNAKSQSLLASQVDLRITKAPVVLFSHGASTPVEVYTNMFEHLASHGYFVFAISHLYNSAAVELPDGTVIKKNGSYFNNRWTKEVGEKFEAMMDFVKSDNSLGAKQKVVRELYSNGFPPTMDMEIWRKDITDALDKIEALNKDKGHMFYGKLNLEQIGGFGHSYGGSAMSHSLIMEPRLKTAVNLDGWQFGDKVIDNAFNKPFLYIRGGYPKPDELNKVVYANAGDQMTQVKITGTVHTNFGDLPLLTGPDNIFKTGTIDSLRCAEVINNLLLYFFNAQLKGQKGPWKTIERKFEEVSIEELYK